MKKIIVIALIIPAFAYVTTHFEDNSLVGQVIHSLFALLMAGIVLAFFWGFYRFGRWHMGFHRKMKTHGLWGPK